jgi:hypothetical protein
MRSSMKWLGMSATSSVEADETDRANLNGQALPTGVDAPAHSGSLLKLIPAMTVR